MKTTYFLLFMLCFQFLAVGQDWDFEKPNYKTIEKNIEDEASNLFYPNLMKRFKAADSTMTLEEKRHLYYGYSFQKDYSPYSHSDYEDSLRAVLQKDKLESVDFENIQKFGDSILSDNPFNIRALNYQLYVLENTGDKALFNKKVIQLNTLFDALISSGNGTTKEDAFYVIETTHEYDLISILGLTFGGQQSLIEHYDYLTLAANDAEIEGLYFEITPCLNSLSRMFED